jgi:hypothetical protein
MQMQMQRTSRDRAKKSVGDARFFYQDIIVGLRHF